MRRNPDSYKHCKPEAVASGSEAQMVYFVDDAKADIEALLEVVEAMAKFSGRNNNAALKQMAIDALKVKP